MTEFRRRDVLLLRNIIHGAPISVVRLATILHETDQKLNLAITDGREPFIKDRAYYERVATRVHERLQQEV